jgi:alpha-L-rhamnosidase
MRITIAAAAILVMSGCAYDERVTNLRCEYLVNPLGIDVVQPRFCWLIESARRGQKQTAYQVLVAGSAERIAEDKGDLWDSGKVASDQTAQVEYQGKTLDSRMRCWWKVRVWD